jgi:hypothetical protein
MVATGRFVCFACGAWGYMETARAQWRVEHERQPEASSPSAARITSPPAATEASQAALPGSYSETDLRQRSIPPRYWRVTARCGCARARSMRWRCWPQEWHVWWPSSASITGGGTGDSTCAQWHPRRTSRGRSSSAVRLPGRSVGDTRLRAGVRGVWGAEDVSAAWAAGVLAVGAWSAAVAGGGEGLAMSQHQRESWAERVAIMVTDGSMRPRTPSA